MSSEVVAVRLEPWGEGDLWLLEQLNSPEMTEHLGGPESREKLLDRQHRYERMDPVKGRVFKIVDEASGEAAGSVAYWDRVWDGVDVFEIGWAVRTALQGRGIAGAGVTQAMDAARADGRHRLMYAFPNVDNAPSNAICRKLGFELIEDRDFEYPKGSFMRCNVWRRDLTL